MTDGSQPISLTANKNRGPPETKRVPGIIKGISVNITTNIDTHFLVTKEKATKYEKRRK